jgi:CubicO group peptidase (beta-lactamase class C family)
MKHQARWLWLSWCGFLSLSSQSQDFDSSLQCHQQAHVPGVVVQLVQHGKQVYSAALGVADLTSKQPLQTTDIFQIGSVSKQFTAAAILLLEQQQKLRLDDTLGKFIQGLPADYAAVTLKDVLSHTAGLPNYTQNPQTMVLAQQKAELDVVVQQLVKDPVQSKAGQLFAYSNTGYVLLGKVIEVVSGSSYSDYLQQHIFQPLGMKHSFVVGDKTSAATVMGYSSQQGAQGDQTPRQVDRSWISAAGAIASTLSDMALWQQGLMSGKLLSKSQYQQMITPATLANGDKVPYGLGFHIYPIAAQLSYSHEGMVPGFFSFALYLPQQELYAVAFSNDDSNHPGPLLLDLIALQLGLSPKVVAGSVTAEIAARYTGKYVLSDRNTRTISYQDGQLFSQINDGKKQLLQLRQNNAFSYRCTEDYFVLEQIKGRTALVPVSLYRGRGEPQFKL